MGYKIINVVIRNVIKKNYNGFESGSWFSLLSLPCYIVEELVGMMVALNMKIVVSIIY